MPRSLAPYARVAVLHYLLDNVPNSRKIVNLRDTLQGLPISLMSMGRQPMFVLDEFLTYPRGYVDSFLEKQQSIVVGEVPDRVL
jgi:hypothetical protein